MLKMNKDSKILITGWNGMVGNNLINKLEELGYDNLILSYVDLRDQYKIDYLFKKEKPDYVFHLAAKVGGIKANIDAPAEFLYDNLMINSNVIESARKYNVKRLLYLGSSCIYPRNCKQPMKENMLLSGKLEPTNEGYALSKIAGLKLCEYYNKQYGTDFICLMPPNMYGKYDHFKSAKSHVISSLMSKFHDAKLNNEKSVVVWGNGMARREFLYVEDCVEAMIYFMKEKKNYGLTNIGINADISIKKLAELIKEVVGYEGDIKYDKKKPNGMMKKLLNSKKANDIGWKAKTNLKEGLKKTYDWWCKQ